MILITGAAQRVGSAVAQALAKRGAHIAFSYYAESEPWRDTYAVIEGSGVRVFAQQADITDPAQVRSLVQAVSGTLGRIDVLINNASVWLRKPALQISVDDWQLEMDVNVKGTFLMSQAVAPVMQAIGGGLIINMTDLSAFQAWDGYAHHSAAKAAIVALTRVLALEWAPAIRVNAIAPGTVLLPENAEDSKRDWAVGKSVLKRIGAPVDVARTVMYLMEEDFATGSVYFVDGGRSLV